MNDHDSRAARDASAYHISDPDLLASEESPVPGDLVGCRVGILEPIEHGEASIDGFGGEDASVDLGDIENDFALIAQAGLGGMELLGYYLYGNYPSMVQEGGPVPVDWTEYGWGSEAWSTLLF